MDRDALQQQFLGWLRETTPETYVDARNAVVVPRRSTRVVVDSEPLDDGRHAITIRAPILQDIEPKPQLAVYVALHANAFRLGNLYLFKVGESYDLDYSYTLMDTWVGKEGLAELVAVAETSAASAAQALHERFGGRLPNPEAAVRQTSFAGPEQWGRQDVYDLLADALGTQQVLVSGTAERVERSKDRALADGWFVVTGDHLWFAGRDERHRGSVVWRIPHADVRSDRVSSRGSASTYSADLANGAELTVTARTTEAVVALRDARRDPRDPEESGNTGGRHSATRQQAG